MSPNININLRLSKFEYRTGKLIIANHFVHCIYQLRGVIWMQPVGVFKLDSMFTNRGHKYIQFKHRKFKLSAIE